ncbi:MAG: AraC family transcriptional regulator [Alphaproteobacteria bacterium]|nr:AraC family transcriptional regulator [Alphaproteobacteria bacterium]
MTTSMPQPGTALPPEAAPAEVTQPFSTPATTAQIVWPRSALAGCIFCMIVRDTRGVALGHSERFNFFPASPLCCVTWMLAGDCYLVDGPQQLKRPWTGAKVPSLAFSGAQLGPLVSWNPGETHAITIAFYPDAFSAMTGLDLSHFVGRMVPAEDALPMPVLEACREALATTQTGSVQHGFSVLEDNIATLWKKSRPDDPIPVKWLTDWTRSLVARAALSGPGRSTRQIARRVKAWSGVSQRDLHGLSHSEQLYANLHEALEHGQVDWAELAAASGFSDQAHMIRRMRRHTGFTPEQLRKSAATDESFWAYRLLGQYFSKP